MATWLAVVALVVAGVALWVARRADGVPSEVRKLRGEVAESRRVERALSEHVQRLDRTKANK